MRIGELFSGYGGLGMGVQSVLGGDVVWHSDIDKGACKILAHRFPDVPNVGDVTAVDWSSVEPVDIITGGSPCQDLSHAGRRAGMSEGTRSNLWVAMREAIAALRPPLVIWENVRGAYSAGADSELETRPGLLDSVRRRDGEPVLRALGRVLGDLSDLGYDAQWHGLRAADVGAPHGRFRVFVIATDTRGERGPQAIEHDGRGAATGDRAGLPDESDRVALRAGPVGELLPTPAAHDSGNSVEEHLRKKPGRTKVTSLQVMARGGLLPTPTTTQRGVDSQRDDRPGAGPNLHNSVALLPTPRASDGEKGGPNQRGSSGDLMLPAAVQESRWGDYAAAITRWEAVLGRPAPAPTMTSAKGNPQLSPVFVEWMMGLPAGWVTGVPGITRNEALRALGNGVVPAQCAAALRLMLGGEAMPVAAAGPLLPTVKATNNENRQSFDQYGMNLGQALGITPLEATP